MSKYYFVGSGIASLAGAAYLIRDGNVSGSHILIFEESKEAGRRSGCAWIAEDRLLHERQSHV